MLSRSFVWELSLGRQPNRRRQARYAGRHRRLGDRKGEEKRKSVKRGDSHKIKKNKKKTYRKPDTSIMKKIIYT